MQSLRTVTAVIFFCVSAVVIIGAMLVLPTRVAADSATVVVGDGMVNDLADQEYERLLVSYQDWTFGQLRQHLGLQDHAAKPLSFDPESAAHYEAIRSRLKLTDDEDAKFKSSGFVVVDPQLRHSFGSVYYQIYASDLPVFVTSDSVLHAWHRSYENLLLELERRILMPALAGVLKDCHELLASRANLMREQEMSASCRDVDLYLTVARNLLEGAGSPNWFGDLRLPSVHETDDQALARLADIRSLKLQVQFPRTESTRIYGGERFVDYSQFQPRGHYTKSSQLQNYFRCMMWLGRADCGFHVLPVDPGAGIDSDWQRELRDAALLSQLVRDSNNLERLSSMTRVVQLLVGESDNLTVSGMLELFDREGLAAARDLTAANSLETFAGAIWQSGVARQRIRSQSIVSNPHDTYRVPPPDLFQMFGQVFAVDSLLLSYSVFDSIIFQGEKQQRMMPSGLDVAAALGNDYAVGLLEPELREWNYSANLLAGREFIEQLKPEFWEGNLYHRWLDALRTLDDEPASASLPEVMRGSVWRAKQLQTQLASWSELRHDNVLYSKQSYTGVPGCRYPAGFVEPYPELYAKLSDLAKGTAAALRELDIDLRPLEQRTQDRQIHFVDRFSEIMDRLEVIAQQELRAEPMTAAQRRFIETTIDRRGSLPHGSGSKPRYDGWYSELVYSDDPSLWSPTIADVHTNPTAHEALHAGVGDVNLAVIAIDSECDLAAYVGPVYSYYEFAARAENRLNDRGWQQLIAGDSLPSRPDWAQQLIASPTHRTYDGLSVQSDGKHWTVMKSNEGRLELVLRVEMSDEGLERLLAELHARGFAGRFGISLCDVTPTGLQSLVEVPQLAWIDVAGSQIPEEAIEEFSRRRPDVELLPLPFGVRTVRVCRQIDGFQRFIADASRELQPGRPLLLYVEPENLTWSRQRFQLAAKFQVRMSLLDDRDDVVAALDSGPLEFEHGRQGDVVYAKLTLPIPRSLPGGAYSLQVELTDGRAEPVRTATAELKLKCDAADAKSVGGDAK